MAKLTRSWRNILQALADAAPGVRSPCELPDGNGRAGCARVGTLTEMVWAKVIIPAREETASGEFMLFKHGYAITPAGLRALSEHKGE